MSVLFNIHSVAKYESKLLTRSWFYRIFMILAILFLGVFNGTTLISEQGSNWFMKALPANIPYINLMLLNTGQAIIAVFLSSEFLKSDKKLDTSEVFYVHSLSNAEYVLGKVWGNMRVFLRLNLIGIGLVIIFNLISGVSVDWLAYLVYFFLICIPTLIYIFGLSIALMLLFKSQAVTFVLLLGYIALTLFYIGDKFYYLFDYMVYNLPMVKSTIVGFSNWGVLINHRMIYLMLGLGFICISIFMFRRLPNTNRGKYRWLGLSFVFIAAGLWASYHHVGSILHTENRRQLFTKINNQHVNDPKMVVNHYDISIKQHPQTISSEVKMDVRALQQAAIFTFCLNPGLEVTEVTENNKTLQFTRNHQILQVDFGREIAAGDSICFTLKYNGTIDESFCYLDIPSSILQEEFSDGLFKIDKKYSFQDKNYLLFTPETYWYPRPGTSYSSDNPDWQQSYFSHFSLKVKTINGLKALSQGTMKWPIAKRERVEVKKDNNSDSGEGDAHLVAVNEDRQPRRRRSNDSIDEGGRRPMRERPSGEAREGRVRRERPTGEVRGDSVRRVRPTGEAREGGVRRERAAGAERTSRRGEWGDRRQLMNRDSLQALRGSEQALERDSLLKENRKEFRTTITYDSIFVYETDFLTPAITLIIGDYEQKSVEVDETVYSIWNIRGNDYFSELFNSIVDTIPSQIRERRRAIEMNYSLDYSFNRFSVIEVPIQFYSYSRTWTQAQEVMQPEMVLFPEKGSLVQEADVEGTIRNEKRWAQRGRNQVSDEEIVIRAFNRFMQLFERTQSNFDWSLDRGALNVTTTPNPFFIFPQLYNFRYNVFSSEWPVSNRLIELYLQDETDNHYIIRQMNGISNNEKASLLMEEYPFKELLANVEHRDLLDNITALKANCLFALAEHHIGIDDYRDSLRAVLDRNTFTNLRFEHLLDTLGAIANVDLHTPLKAWNTPTNLPFYTLWTPEVTQITNRDKEVFVLKQQIVNDSDYDGIVDVEVNFRGGQSAIRDPREKRKVPIKAHETVNLVSVWDEAPSNVNINTLISANLPATINLPITDIVRERNKPIVEERDYIVENPIYSIPGEVIVDNEDSTLFILSEPEVVGLLPQWLDRVDNDDFSYSGVSDWQPPLQWTLTTNDKYYGAHIRSAYVIKSGRGNQTATWKIPVEESGQYDLFYWIYKPEELRRRRRGRGGSSDAEYHFKVKYDNHEDNAYIDLQQSDEGWSELGTYFFSKDTVEVVLNNNSKLRSVTADAVKIVKR